MMTPRRVAYPSVLALLAGACAAVSAWAQPPAAQPASTPASAPGAQPPANAPAPAPAQGQRPPSDPLPSGPYTWPPLPAPTTTLPERLNVLAIGSCSRENRPTPIFATIANQKPDVFLFLGDNIYGDTSDMDVFKRKYVQQAMRPEFQQLRNAVPLLATWDDHDYGNNDMGADYDQRLTTQQLFLDFFGVPADSPRRTRAGIYDAVLIGPPGQRVQIITLDTRYHRSPLARKGDRGSAVDGFPGPYRPSDEATATFLGEEQWAWLEAQLREPAQIRIIGSSIQFVSEEHGFEKWANFPGERTRMVELINRTNAAGVIFVSGDRHWSELSTLRPGGLGVRPPTPEELEPPVADSSLQPRYPLFDLTSSGLNQGRRGFSNELNRHRVGMVYTEPSYGNIRIDWSQPDPLITFEIVDIEARPQVRYQVRLSTLQPR